MSLPKDYSQEAKSGGRYVMQNIDDKPTKIRILADFITGMSVWGEGEGGKRKSTKVRNGVPMPVAAIGISKFTNQPEKVKDFIAAPCWNYKTDQLEIFETDKGTVIEQIMDHEANEEYGDCVGYDLSIKKIGKGKETKYIVHVSPPKKVDKAISDALENESIDITKLYDDESPFITQAEEVLGS